MLRPVAADGAARPGARNVRRPAEARRGPKGSALLVLPVARGPELESPALVCAGRISPGILPPRSPAALPAGAVSSRDRSLWLSLTRDAAPRSGFRGLPRRRLPGSQRAPPLLGDRQGSPRDSSLIVPWRLPGRSRDRDGWTACVPGNPDLRLVDRTLPWAPEGRLLKPPFPARPSTDPAGSRGRRRIRAALGSQSGRPERRIEVVGARRERVVAVGREEVVGV